MVLKLCVSVCVSESRGGLVKMQIAGPCTPPPTPVSDSVSLEWGQRIGISTKLPRMLILLI